MKLRLILLAILTISATALIFQGCKRGGPPDEADPAPSSEAVKSFNTDLSGGWTSECTNLTTLNILGLQATLAKSAQITVQSSGDGQATLALLTYPNKSDCTLNIGESITTYSKIFKVMPISVNEKQGELKLQLEAVDPCDKTNYLTVISMSADKRALTAKLGAAQFRLTSQSQLQFNESTKCVPESDVVQQISPQSPLIGARLKFKKSW